MKYILNYLTFELKVLFFVYLKPFQFGQNSSFEKKMKLFTTFLVVLLVTSIECLPVKRDFSDLFKSQLELQKQMMTQHQNMINQIQNLQKNEYEKSQQIFSENIKNMNNLNDIFIL